jgi:hypothetical protein
MSYRLSFASHSHVHLYVIYFILIHFGHSALDVISPRARGDESTKQNAHSFENITAIVFHEPSQQWVTAQGSELVIWDANCREQNNRLVTKVAKIHDLKFNASGSKLVVVGGVPGESGVVELYTWPEHQAIVAREIGSDTLLRVDWDSEHARIGIAASTGRLWVLEDEGLTTCWDVDAHPQGCTAIELFAQQGWVVSGGNDGVIRIWNLANGETIRSLSQHTDAIVQLSATPPQFDAKRQLVSIGRDQTVRLWDAETGRLIRFVRLAAVPTEAQWEKGGGSSLPMLWVLSEDGRLRRIDLKKAAIEQDIDGNDQATFALGLRGNTLYVAGTTSQPEIVSIREPLKRIVVAQDGSKFVTEGEASEFRVRGFNYDHDSVGRLIEDYWNEQWTEIENDFCEMQELGANTIRIHLQFGKFMKSATEPDLQSLAKFTALVQLAERTRLYLDVTGLGCYHRRDVPVWYEVLGEQERWEAQAVFWQAVVKAAQDSPAIFCWDLMNEPVVPGGKRGDKDWLGPAFGDKHFVQFITLDQANRPRPEIAKAWTRYLATAIRQTGDKAMITVGLVDWSLKRPGLTSGFEPEAILADVDFIAMHLYPQSDQLEKDIETLRGFRLGKPLIIEECFPLRCKIDELRDFLRQTSHLHNGWISFYWGSTPDQLKEEKTIAAAITRQWLMNLP